jgi:hypothetical protein
MTSRQPPPEPGTPAVLIVYENLWSIPFIVAAWESGGEAGRERVTGRAGRHGRTAAAEANHAEPITTSGD